MKTKMQRHIDINTIGNDQIIKYPNGTLIIAGNRDFNTPDFYLVNNMYRTTINEKIAFPVPFINSPVVIVTTGSTIDYDFCYVSSVTKDVNAIKAITLDRPNQPSSKYVGIQFIAIGKWK